MRGSYLLIFLQALACEGAPGRTRVRGRGRAQSTRSPRHLCKAETAAGQREANAQPSITSSSYSPSPSFTLHPTQPTLTYSASVSETTQDTISKTLSEILSEILPETLSGTFLETISDSLALSSEFESVDADQTKVPPTTVSEPSSSSPASYEAESSVSSETLDPYPTWDQESEGSEDTDESEASGASESEASESEASESEASESDGSESDDNWEVHSSTQLGSSSWLSGVSEDSGAHLTVPTVERIPCSTISQSNSQIIVLPTLSSSQVPHTTGIIATSRLASGRESIVPIITESIPGPTSTLTPTISSLSIPESTSTAEDVETMAIKDIFAEPIGTKAPPSNIKIRDDHPVPRKGISSGTPLQTNKFFANLFLGDQTGPVFTHPYSVMWVAGKDPTGSFGFSVSHIEAGQRVYGATKYNGAVSWFINPVGIQSVVLSAKDLSSDTVLTADGITASSCVAHLRKDANSTPSISFPLVQGMGFITAQYYGGFPVIQTGVYFRTVTKVTKDPKADVAKFKLRLEDGTTWIVYAYKTQGDQMNLEVSNNGYAESTTPFYGTLQVAKDPGDSESILDEAAGIYPVAVELTGEVDGSRGSYTFQFQSEGHPSGTLMMFALPHHVQSFDDDTSGAIVNNSLQTTTKGMAVAVLSNEWTMVEPDMPVDMGFSPFSPDVGPASELSDEAKTIVSAAASREVSQNMIAQANLDSMYFSGKALAKFAQILFVINDMLDDKALALTGLGQLKEAFAIFANNTQKYPLVYERAWGGVVSSASYVTGDDGVDFGNTYYNDHHFHWGYFILSAAIMGHIDPSWVKDNKDFVDMLCRDIANPSSKDKYFPEWRAYDWYHGHSWAHGLYASIDGKDQESSSEDVMHAYALKMWGKVSGNANMEARGNLQLAVLARSLNNYYLYTSDNDVQPANFIGNKVAGILFENKIDHTTYFGSEIEYIQGIHMVPLLAPSAYARKADFVKEEWDLYFGSGKVDAIDSAWKGIIYGNYATINPSAAWSFFNDRDFKPSWLDGGASLTWYLAYSAALGDI